MQVSKKFYDDIHSKRGDPWNYARRAAEILRHDLLLSMAASHASRQNISSPFILDVGCSTGILTQKLSRLTDKVCGMDLSESALTSAANGKEHSAMFAVGQSAAIPFQNAIFDVLILADGISEWQLTEPGRGAVLNETCRALRPGGLALFTDYMRPSQFETLIKTVQQSPLKIVAIRYLNDRLWYQFESMFKSVRDWPVVRQILSSLNLAKLLAAAGSIMGPAGSRHILIAAQKKT